MGEPAPCPGISTFQSGFLGSIVGSGPSATPVPFGPRNLDQSAPEAIPSVHESARQDINRKRLIGHLVGFRRFVLPLGWQAVGGLGKIIANVGRDATVW